MDLKFLNNRYAFRQMVLQMSNERFLTRWHEHKQKDKKKNVNLIVDSVVL